MFKETLPKLFFMVSLIINFSTSQVPETRPTPFATLYDQAMQKLNQLNEEIDAKISEIKLYFAELRIDFDIQLQEIQTFDQDAVNNEITRIEDQIAVTKSSAESAGADIDICVRGHEIYLLHLANTILGQALRCISMTSLRVHMHIFETIQGTESRTSNALTKLYNELTACTTGSIICVTPVASQIDEAAITLPELVESRVPEIVNYVASAIKSTDTCSKDYVSMYITSADSILEDIVACADRLMSRK